VIDGGQATVGPSHTKAAFFQFIEGLRRGYLVQQVQIYVKNRRCFGGFLSNNMSPPDFLEQR